MFAWYCTCTKCFSLQFTGFFVLLVNTDTFSNCKKKSVSYCIVQIPQEPTEPKFPPNLVYKRFIKNKIRLSTCSQTSFEAQKLHSASLRTQQALGPVGTRNGYYIHKHTTLAEVLGKHPCRDNVPVTLILSLVVKKNSIKTKTKIMLDTKISSIKRHYT